MASDWLLPLVVAFLLPCQFELFLKPVEFRHSSSSFPVFDNLLAMTSDFSAVRNFLRVHMAHIELTRTFCDYVWDYVLGWGIVQGIKRIFRASHSVLHPHALLVAVNNVGSLEVIERFLIHRDFGDISLFLSLFSRYFKIYLRAKRSKILVKAPDTPKRSHRIKYIKWLTIQLIAIANHLRENIQFRGCPRAWFYKSTRVICLARRYWSKTRAPWDITKIWILWMVLFARD